MEFTKEKTNITKGIAICLMFFNHLYSFPNRLVHSNYYIPTFPWFNAEFYIGNFGNVCVSIFIFMSGYGMFLGYINSGESSLKYSLKKLRDFYINYWKYFLIFVPIGLFFFKNTTLWDSTELRYSADPFTLLENFLGWSARYNSEWWFVNMFIFTLIFLSPFYMFFGKENPSLLILVSISLFVISYVLKVGYSDGFSFIFWQISFAVGILCARSSFFLSKFICYFKGFKIAWLFLYMLIFFVIRYRLGAKIDFLFVPIFIYVCLIVTEALKMSSVLAYIGRYSFSMWLVHSFFCYYYLQDFIYYPKWSPLIFILLISTSLISVISIDYLQLYFKNKLKWRV
jgi:peptidoglycan/LPS O-acetylase OafA/YrhL